MDWDEKKVEELVRILDKYGLTEVEISEGDSRIVLKRETMSFQANDFLNGLRTKNGQGYEINNHKTVVDFEYIAKRKALQDELMDSSKETHVDEDKAETRAMSGDNDIYIKAPMAGIFYRRSHPDNPPFVDIGQHVEKGKTICLVEAMKMINEIPSSHNGIIKEFLVEDGQFVEYDSPLLIITED